MAPDGFDRGRRRGGQGRRAWWPERFDARGDTPQRRFIENAREGASCCRSFLPRHHRQTRRRTQHGERDLSRRNIRLERHTRSNRRRQRLGSGADDPFSLNPQRPYPLLDQLAMLRSGADHCRPGGDCHDAAKKRGQLLRGPAASARRVGDHDDGRAGGGQQVARAGDARRTPTNSGRLRQVQRHAAGQSVAIVDQPDARHLVAQRERVGNGVPELAGADDGDIQHGWAIV